MPGGSAEAAAQARDLSVRVASRLADILRFTCNPAHLGCNLLQGSRGHAFETTAQLFADNVPSLTSSRSDFAEFLSTSNTSLTSGRGNALQFPPQAGGITGEMNLYVTNVSHGTPVMIAVVLPVGQRVALG